MSGLRIGGLAKISEVGRKDFWFPYRKKLIGKRIKIDSFGPNPAFVHESRNGPWLLVTGLIEEDVVLNRERVIKKGGWICFRQAKIISLPN